MRRLERMAAWVESTASWKSEPYASGPWIGGKGCGEGLDENSGGAEQD